MEAGQVAYEGFRRYWEMPPLVPTRPAPESLPPWDQADPDVRAAWRAAADCVVMWLQLGGAE